MKYSLYVHITPNGKLYIGITHKSPIEKRWGNDGLGYKTQRLFWRAIQKYGWDNIQHIVLVEGLSKEVAYESEKYLIAKYNTTNPQFGYNIREGGQGGCFHHTEEVKEKLRQLAYKQFANGMPESTKLKISEHSPHYNKGMVMSQEQKDKISKANKGKHNNRKGVKLSADIRKKISNGHKGQIPWNKGLYGYSHKPLSQETRDKISKKHIGKKLSETTKQKLHDVNAGKKISDDTKQKMSISHKGKKFSEEAKRNMSEAKKLWWAKRKQQ